VAIRVARIHCREHRQEHAATQGGDLSTGELIVIALRIIIPLAILRWPLGGGLAAVLADAGDVVAVELIGLGGFGGHYSELDKALDTYYLTLELLVALGWESPWARWTAIALFADRAVGVVLFEITGTRVLLLVFPNLFETWWLYCVFVERFAPRVYPRSLRSTVVPLVLLLIPKLVQEYMLHYLEVKPWRWIKMNILGTD
jgi:hypothetical protein